MTAFKTTNGGSTWTTSVLRSDSGSCGYAIAQDPLNANVLYAGGSSCFYASSDGGATWGMKSSPGGIVFAIAAHLSASGRIFAGTSSGLYKSEDGGATWQAKGAGPFRALAMTLGAANMIYAGGQNGVRASSDGGQTWTDINAGLETLDVRTLAYNAGRRSLYAGTYGGGVFAYQAPALAPPLDFRGIKKTNRSLLRVEAIIDLSWRENPANPAISAYRVYRIEAAGGWTLIAETGPATLGYRVRGVGNAAEYAFAVAAVGAEGEEGEAATATVK